MKRRHWLISIRSRRSQVMPDRLFHSLGGYRLVPIEGDTLLVISTRSCRLHRHQHAQLAPGTYQTLDNNTAICMAFQNPLATKDRAGLVRLVSCWWQSEIIHWQAGTAALFPLLAFDVAGIASTGLLSHWALRVLSGHQARL